MGSDGAGGAVLAWQDLRGGATEDVYAHRVLARAHSHRASREWLRGLRAGAAAVRAGLLADGAGGAIIAWQDNRAKVTSDTYDIYAQHVLGTGTPDPAWPTNGRAGLHRHERADGSAHRDRRLGRRGDRNGWTTVRSRRSSRARNECADRRGGSRMARQRRFPRQRRPRHKCCPGWSPDGAGGAIAVTLAIVSSVYDVVATHVLATGVLDPAWSTSQVTLRKGLTAQVATACASDGAGGAFVAWPDNRGGSSTDLCAPRARAESPIRCIPSTAAPSVHGGGEHELAEHSRVRRHRRRAHGPAGPPWTRRRRLRAQNPTTFGVLGDPEPAIVSVTDLPADQGGRVRIRFNASQMDVVPYYEIVSYGIWRRVTAAAAAQAIARGATLQREGAAAEPAASARSATARSSRGGRPRASCHARGDAWYTFVAETFRDSSATGNPFTAFRVGSPRGVAGGLVGPGARPGYSVDNLAPATPAPFTGSTSPASARPHWNPNVERDPAGYRIYRGSIDVVRAGAGNRIASPADTGYGRHRTDQRRGISSRPWTSHGNESAVAALTPSGTADVEPADAGGEASFAAPWPNRRAPPRCWVHPCRARSVSGSRFTMPAGRYVRELANGIHEPGDHTAAWDLRDAGANGWAQGSTSHGSTWERDRSACARSSSRGDTRKPQSNERGPERRSSGPASYPVRRSGRRPACALPSSCG